MSNNTEYNNLPQDGSLSRRFVILTDLTYKPVLSAIIQNELLGSTVVTTTKRNNVVLDIGISDKKPHALYEVYRLIEQCFRTIGGWTWAVIKDDTYNKKFRQLVTFNPGDGKNKIIAFYRYGMWADCLQDGFPVTPMTSFWDFDEWFIQAHKNKILELWTAGINVELDKTTADGKRSPERWLLAPALHSSWTGLAWAVKEYGCESFIGKMTIPANYPKSCRDLVLAYLEQYYTKNPPSAKPKKPYISRAKLPEWLCGDYAKDNSVLCAEIERLSDGKEKGLPLIFDNYLSRIPRFEYIGTVKNGEVYEAGMFVAVKDVDEKIIKEHFGYVDAWKQKHPGNEKISLAQYKASLSLAEQKNN